MLGFGPPPAGGAAGTAGFAGASAVDAGGDAGAAPGVDSEAGGLIAPVVGEPGGGFAGDGAAPGATTFAGAAAGLTAGTAVGFGGSRFTNLRVIRSLSPIAAYLSRSLSPPRKVGGSDHTPSGWSFVSFLLALTSDFAASLKPAFSTSSITKASGKYPCLLVSSGFLPGAARCCSMPSTPFGLSTR